MISIMKDKDNILTAILVDVDISDLPSDERYNFRGVIDDPSEIPKDASIYDVYAMSDDPYSYIRKNDLTVYRFKLPTHTLDDSINNASKDTKFDCCNTCNKLEIKYREGQIDAKKRFLETMDQSAKADNGKPQLTLVPRQIIFDIARVREYGNAKYGDPDNWKNVEIERYRDAAFRHFMAYLDDPYGVDKESGLPHLAHLACNIAFLCEMQKEENG